MEKVTYQVCLYYSGIDNPQSVLAECYSPRIAAMIQLSIDAMAAHDAFLEEYRKSGYGSRGIYGPMDPADLSIRTRMKTTSDKYDDCITLGY